MPIYRCIVSRRIADVAYAAGSDYEMSADLAQRYAAYFETEAAARAASPTVIAGTPSARGRRI